MIVETFQSFWYKVKADGVTKTEVSVSAGVAHGKKDPPKDVFPGTKKVYYDTTKKADRNILGVEFLAKLESPTLEERVKALEDGKA